MFISAMVPEIVIIYAPLRFLKILKNFVVTDIVSEVSRFSVLRYTNSVDYIGS